MRLLECSLDGQLRLTEDIIENIPAYAVLSHTWDGQEVTFGDFQRGTGKGKAGYRKIELCGKQAARDGLRYFWIDTCCIDKSNSTELSEAINSMFRWYQNATRCYAYLSDISINDGEEPEEPSRPTWESAFRRSRWFTRGWTLQELIAPSTVQFFSSEWQLLGDKRSLEPLIQDSTKIPVEVLRGRSLAGVAFEDVMLWFGTRQTTREEDSAYCLLGLCNVFLPPIYGEGRKHAFVRLRLECERRQGLDHNGATTDTIRDTSPRSCHQIPFPKNKRFIGRNVVLDTLRSKLRHPQECQRFAVVGLGGIGKTQVALSFAYWVQENEPDFSTFWVPALSTVSFEQSYLDIAAKLGVQTSSKDEDIKKSLKRHLSSGNAGKLLLVVDNADESDILFGSSEKPGICEYLPEGESCLILLTTRSKDVAGTFAGDDIIDLEALSRQEANDLLRNSLMQRELLDDDTVITELIRELTYLPLAITQATAYMNRNQITPRSYLELLRGTEHDMVNLISREFHDTGRYRGAHNAVATTWLVSFEQIRKSDPPAADLLSFLSCIEPKAIPRSILPEHGSEEELVNSIGTLCVYTFLTRRGDDDMFDMHSLVHKATRLWIQRRNLAEKTADCALQHLQEIFPDCHRTHRALWRRYLPHALSVLRRSQGRESRTRYDLNLAVGHCLYTDYRYREALERYEDAVEWSKTFLPEDDKSRLFSQLRVGLAYIHDRRHDCATPILEYVVERYSRTSAVEDEDRLTAQYALARAYIDRGRLQDSISILEHVSAVRERTSAEVNTWRLAAQHQLAGAYYEDGRIKDAIRILEHIKSIDRTVVEETGEESLGQLDTIYELARAYLKDGRADEAIPLLQHVVQMDETILQEDSYHRLVAEHTLARAYRRTDRPKDAIPLLSHVVTVRKRILAENDPDRLETEIGLARAYHDDNQIEEVILLLQPLVDTKKEVLPEDNPDRLDAEHELGRAYRYAGRPKEAIPLFEHVISMDKEKLPDDNSNRLTTMTQLAKAYLEDSRVEEATSLFEQVAAIKEKIPTGNDSDKLESPDSQQRPRPSFRAHRRGAAGHLSISTKLRQLFKR